MRERSTHKASSSAILDCSSRRSASTGSDSIRRRCTSMCDSRLVSLRRCSLLNQRVSVVRKRMVRIRVVGGLPQFYARSVTV